MKRTNHASDYPDEVYHLLAKSENKHFWFRGRNYVIRHVIEKTWRHPKNKTILEIGCGTGYVLTELARMGFRVSGLDMHTTGLSYAAKRVPEATLIQSDIFRFRPTNRYDAIGMFDVIEHMTEDADIIMRCREMLRPRGTMFITVPARPELFSYYDVVSGHKRRYTKPQLKRLLSSCGFDVCSIEYFGLLQYVPHFFMKRLILKPSLMGRTDAASVIERIVWRPPTIVNALFEASMRLDIHLSDMVPLPLGTSLILVAQKTL